MHRRMGVAGWAVAGALVGAAGIAALLAGCDGKTARKGKLRFAFVTNNVSGFWKIANGGTDEAERTLGIEVDFRMPKTGQAHEQREIIDDLLAQQVDGIAISPIDPKNQTPMLDRVAGQTILLCHDSDAPESKRVAYVGTNNVGAGRAAGNLIKEVLPGGGKIMLFVGNMDAQNARERRQGILEVLKGSGIEVIDTRTDGADTSKARQNADDTLVAHPDVACLVGLWSYNGPTIAQAVKAADKVGKVKIVCFDEDEVTLQAIKDGVIYGTVVQQPYEFGLRSMKVLKALAEGDRSVVPANKIIDIPVIVVKKGNVDEFWAKLNRLLGK